MDRVEKLIRAARPAAEPLSARAEADLAHIVGTTKQGPLAAGMSRSGRRYPSRWVWALAAAVVAALVITGIGVIRPSDAVAATPPMLTISPVGSDPAKALLAMKARAGAQPDHSSQTAIVSQWWGLASEVNASGLITSSHVDPRRRVATLGRHGITSYTDYAAQSYDTQGRPVQDTKTGIPGTKIETVELDPDQQVFTKDPPTDPAKFGSYFSDALDPYSDSAAINAFSDIRSLLSERILSPAQNAALLGYLATVPDVSLLGSSTDRLSRPVWVLASPIEKDNQTMLMLSADTGGFLSTEVIYRGSTRRDLPSPAVIEYVAWETP